MVLHRATGKIAHRVFRDLSDYLRPHDCLVLNATRVVPARFSARRPTGGRIDGLFLRETATGRWEVMLNGAGRLKDGESLSLGAGRWSMRLMRRLERGICEVLIEPATAAAEVLDAVGAAPLPPYIRRGPDDDAELAAMDRRRYQTVYARAPGAVAAPTAGLHFTDGLLRALRERGVITAEILLHVGLGTFQPVEVDDLAQHKMHAEWYDLSEPAARTIQTARAAGGRIVAVGTTSVRVLETCAGKNGGEVCMQQGGVVRQVPPVWPTMPPRRDWLQARSGWTDLLIYPPYEFRAVDALITNFHLPGSTLLALVCAFAGREAVLRAYAAAIGERYRFYSYGDAMLIV